MSATTQHAAGLIRTLQQQWDTTFANQSATFGSLGTWELGALKAHLQRSLSKAEQDAALIELLELGHGGHELAERLVLQLMLPKAVSFSRTSAGLRSMDREDALSTAVSTLWETIRTYPLHRRRSVAGNISLEALSTLTKTFGAGQVGPVREYATADEDMHRVLDADTANGPMDPLDDTGDSFRDLVKVLSWAADGKCLSPTEIRILARAELGTRDEQNELSDELGIARDSLNRKVWRIRKKLIQAVQDYIAIHGRW